jgi:hypothetical protein
MEEHALLAVVRIDIVLRRHGHDDLVVLALLIVVAGAGLVAFVFADMAREERQLKASYANIDESRNRAEAIAVQLESYKQREGRYPDSLETLERSLGVKVEPPTVAIPEWRYWTWEDGKGYSLTICFTSHCYPSHSLHSDGSWHVDE